MREEKILNALGEIDEELIDGASPEKIKKATSLSDTAIEKKRKTVYKRWLYTAASFMIAAIAAFALFGTSSPGDKSFVQNNEKDELTGSAYITERNSSIVKNTDTNDGVKTGASIEKDTTLAYGTTPDDLPETYIE